MLRGAVIVLAAALAAVLAGHRLLPALGGATAVLESVLPWLGLGVPVLLAAALAARHRATLLVALLPALVWGVMFGPSLLRSPPGGTADLTVATLNVGVSNDLSATAVREVSQGRDLVALQELTPGGPAAKELNSRYPHHFQVGTVGLWSGYPLAEARKVDVGLGWARALRAVVKAPKGEVTVYVMHLASARPGETEFRDETLAAAGKLVAADKSSRLVLLGDLNTATTDRHREELVPPLADAQEEAGRGFGFTWPANFPITRPDHILFRGMTAVAAGVLEAAGSDHRAATADLRY
ncbi:endonuclease/exonuclease/phosphatase family protein [Acrocarpospora catenulata]|uniref:endonuclease/exonuclease/phosphatase family protein n=1 Tax=Acrocarpospora catenulata TaxID=2836182 RepID=UPI001BDA445F|nr:endonuclease/exonuclease/phosphatase family protein [Acrocarpospora catenulata]